jgi:hypothetical protein
VIVTHRRPSTGLLLLLIASATALPTSVMASGAYGGGRPPTPKTTANDDLYELGQQVFNGTATLADADSALAAKQKPQLDQLGKQLTDMGRANTVSSLAGRLSARQLEGLVRYLSVRFKIN